MAILYVSHRMDEIFRITDKITVLRDGCYVDTLPTEECDEDRIISLMVGRNLSNFYDIKRSDNIQDSILEVKGLTVKNVFKDISFNVRKGEIFGLFGLVGSGRSEIVETIFGARHRSSGEVMFLGERLTDY